MRRLQLAHLPTPLIKPARLAHALDIDLWVKRDDASGGAEAGNKIRKLEFLLGDALDRGADTVITCGGIQSNHARATAVLAASLGLRALLYLRVPDLDHDGDGEGVVATEAHAPLAGNVLIDRLVGAELRLITAATYKHRDQLMERAAAKLRAEGARPYVIPEGGSNGLGALGYVAAMAELRRQLDEGEGGGEPFDLIVHACGSGGTAAGCALGARRHQVAQAVCAMAVCDDAKTFEDRIGGIIAEARSLDSTLDEPARWWVDDGAKGPAYAVSTPEQRACMVETARLSGLVLDPVYTGKAMHGMWRRCRDGDLEGRRILFLHTGGLPGMLAQGPSFAAEI